MILNRNWSVSTYYTVGGLFVHPATAARLTVRRPISTWMLFMFTSWVRFCRIFFHLLDSFSMIITRLPTTVWVCALHYVQGPLSSIGPCINLKWSMVPSRYFITSKFMNFLVSFLNSAIQHVMHQAILRTSFPLSCQPSLTGRPSISPKSETTKEQYINASFKGHFSIQDE